MLPACASSSRAAGPADLFPGIALAEECSGAAATTCSSSEARAASRPRCCRRGLCARDHRRVGPKAGGPRGPLRGLARLPQFLKAEHPAPLSARSGRRRRRLLVGAAGDGRGAARRADRDPRAEQHSRHHQSHARQVARRAFIAFDAARRFFPARRTRLAEIRFEACRAEPVERPWHGAASAIAAAASHAARRRRLAGRTRSTSSCAPRRKHGREGRTPPSCTRPARRPTLAPYAVPGSARLRRCAPSSTTWRPPIAPPTLVVARAGASTLAELTALGRAVDPDPVSLRRRRSPDGERARAGSRPARRACWCRRRPRRASSPTRSRALLARRAPRARAWPRPRARSAGRDAHARDRRRARGARAASRSQAPVTPMFRKRDTRIHFVGIGGIGMSGHRRGAAQPRLPRVAAPTSRSRDTTRRLAAAGRRRSAIGHARAHVGDADVVVISSAVKPTTPRWSRRARARHPGDPARRDAGRADAHEVRHRRRRLARQDHHHLAGGDRAAPRAGLDPTAVIGGKLPSLGSNARLGQGEYPGRRGRRVRRLVPAPLADGRGGHQHRSRAPRSLRHARRAQAHLRRLHQQGAVLRAGGAVPRPPGRAGDPAAAWRSGTSPTGSRRRPTTAPPTCASTGSRSRFTAVRARRDARRGRRWRCRARTTCSTRWRCSRSPTSSASTFDTYRAALAGFAGVGRRFTVRGEARRRHGRRRLRPPPGRDPRHARRRARRLPDRRVVVAFQPHRYTRTRDLLGEFARAFNEADVVVVSDIYAAGEEPIDGVTAARAGRRDARRGPPRRAPRAARAPTSPRARARAARRRHRHHARRRRRVDGGRGGALQHAAASGA